MKRLIIFSCLLSAALTLLAAASGHFRFEPQARPVGEGRSPKLVARRAHGLLMSYTGKSESGKGQDLFFQSSSDLGDSFEGRQGINDVPGEVSDHGENSPLLLASPDESMLYAIWNARDPKNISGSHVRFSRSTAMRPQWSPAITVNDDLQPVSHGFQTAAVAPDGTIYAAWLDGRNRSANETKHHEHGGEDAFTGGTSDLYIARSTDQGKTFQKNVLVAGHICPCCRPSIAFTRNRVLIAWRQVAPGDIRDIYTAASSDGGLSWSKPRRVDRDDWKIKGCPHVGPSMASLGNRLYVAWFSEGGGKPAIYSAFTTDGGESFSTKQVISAGTTDPTHPQIAADDDRIAIVFQARDGAAESGWGKRGVYYREIDSSGRISDLIRAAEGKTGASYPFVALGMSGRMFIGWTETENELQRAYLLRGRAPSEAAKR
jgi:hypothetical protein